MEANIKHQIELLDSKANKRVEKYSSPLLLEFFEGITSLGSPAILLIIIAVLFETGQTLAASKLFASLLIAGIAVRGVKNLNGRTRPEDHRDPVYSEKSFPSGHSTAAFMTATILTAFYSRPVTFFGLATTVAISRVYLKDHYLSDILAGGLLGTVIGIIAVAL